ncbi:hypothetical protein IKE71_00525, partial [Candidatus Saccharibacteria bacterium]|nr:hypothetical protein [Candidatus Saccharibacteria bacterium]
MKILISLFSTGSPPSLARHRRSRQNNLNRLFLRAETSSCSKQCQGYFDCWAWLLIVSKRLI